MKAVKRYICGNGDGIFEHKKGDLILYEDHLKIIQSLQPSTMSAEESQWVRVEERLPENKSFVLINCEYGITLAEFTKFENGNTMWWAITAIGTYQDALEAENVTHWMPLPTPPTK